MMDKVSKMASAGRGRFSALKDKINENRVASELLANLSLSGGLIIQNISQVMIGPVSTAFAGRLGKEELDGVVLGNSMFNILASGVVLGMASACDTYFSQAFGSEQLPLVGVLLQRSLVIHVLVWLVLIPFYLNIEGLVLLLGQEPRISRIAGDYVTVLLPGILFFFMYTVLRKYLSAMNIVAPGSWAGLCGVLVCVICNYLFITVFQLGVMGAAYAMDLAMISMFLFILAYILISKVYVSTWQGWSWKFLDNWWPFTKLGIAGVLMSCPEWIAFEIYVILAGILGATELGAQGIFLNIEILPVAIGFGIADASGILVGQAVGNGDTVGGRLAAKIGFAVAAVTTIIFCLFLLGFRNEVPKIFTTDVDVYQLTTTLIPFMAVYLFLANVASTGRGICRGVAKQGLAALLNIITYYLVSLPIGISLMFLTSLSVIGALIGNIISSCVLALVFFVFILYILDWDKAARQSAERLGADAVKPTESSGLLSRSASLRSQSSIVEPVLDEISDENLDEEEKLQRRCNVLKKRLIATFVVILIALGGILLRVLIHYPQPEEPEVILLSVTDTMIYNTTQV